MNLWQTLKRDAARALVTTILESVIVPGRDPIPHNGAKLLDKRGHVWEVKGEGIRHEGNHATRWWHWDSPEATRVGPLVASKGKR